MQEYYTIIEKYFIELEKQVKGHFIIKSINNLYRPKKYIRRQLIDGSILEVKSIFCFENCFSINNYREISVPINNAFYEGYYNLLNIYHKRDMERNDIEKTLFTNYYHFQRFIALFPSFCFDNDIEIRNNQKEYLNIIKSIGYKFNKFFNHSAGYYECKISYLDFSNIIRIYYSSVKENFDLKPFLETLFKDSNNIIDNELEIEMEDFLEIDNTGEENTEEEKDSNKQKIDIKEENNDAFKQASTNSKLKIINNENNITDNELEIENTGEQKRKEILEEISEEEKEQKKEKEIEVETEEDIEEGIRKMKIILEKDRSWLKEEIESMKIDIELMEEYIMVKEKLINLRTKINKINSIKY